jgi:biopolymer transport protein ExbB
MVWGIDCDGRAIAGLFGTVIEMIDILSFSTARPESGAACAGISVALYNTAGGIMVAVPGPDFTPQQRGRMMVVDMEQQGTASGNPLYGIASGISPGPCAKSRKSTSFRR